MDLFLMAGLLRRGNPETQKLGYLYVCTCGMEWFGRYGSPNTCRICSSETKPNNSRQILLDVSRSKFICCGNSFLAYHLEGKPIACKECKSPVFPADGSNTKPNIFKFSEIDTKEINLSTVVTELDCPICFESKIDVLFDCGHSVCSDCAPKMSICPFCKGLTDNKLSIKWKNDTDLARCVSCKEKRSKFVLNCGHPCCKNCSLSENCPIDNEKIIKRIKMYL